MKNAQRFIFVMLILWMLSACSPAIEATEVETPPQVTSTNAPKATATDSAVPVESPRPVDTATPTIVVPPTETPQETEDEARTLMLQEPPMMGDDVLALEQRMQSLGYSELGLVDGIYDSQTALAVRHLQWLNGERLNGEVTPELYQQILLGEVEKPKGVPPFPARELSLYTAGFMIDGFLKGRLADLGYLDSASPDFDPFNFDELTDEAVKAFQKNNGLSPNGVVDLLAWQALFSPVVVPAEGEAVLTLEEGTDWRTDFYPILEDPIDLAFDGRYIWVLHSGGEDAFFNTLLRIDPEMGLLSQSPPIMPGDLDLPDNEMAEMVFDGNRLWLLLPNGDQPPEMMCLLPETGVLFLRAAFASCESSGCLPSSALGFDGKQVWATASERAWAINRNNGQGFASHFVGWLTEGEMAFDGKCMWMAGEAGLTTFHTGGDYPCQSGELAYALPSGPVAFDGQRIWAANPFGDSVYWLDIAAGILGDPIYTGANPAALAFDGQMLWVANQGDNSIVGIDVATGSSGPPIVTGNAPVALVFDGVYLWVANAGDQTLQKVAIADYPIEIVQPTETPIPSQTPTLAPTPTATIPSLDRNLYLMTPYMEGDDVALLQERLIELGYTEFTMIDAIFGALTDAAVRHFQERNDLVVDGVVGPLTWELLFSPQALGPE